MEGVRGSKNERRRRSGRQGGCRSNRDSGRVVLDALLLELELVLHGSQRPLGCGMPMDLCLLILHFPKVQTPDTTVLRSYDLSLGHQSGY